MEKKINLSTLSYPSKDNYSVLGLFECGKIYHSITIDNSNGSYTLNYTEDLTYLDEVLNVYENYVYRDYDTCIGEHFETAISYKENVKLYANDSIPISNLKFLNQDDYEIVGIVEMYNTDIYTRLNRIELKIAYIKKGKYELKIIRENFPKIDALIDFKHHDRHLIATAIRFNK